MKFINRADAASQLGVSANTITEWSRVGRIRTAGWMKNHPIFTQGMIDEVKEEVRKFGRPSMKDNSDEPIPA